MEQSPNELIKRKLHYISLREKELIVNLYQETLEQNPEIALTDIVESVAKMLQVSATSVKKVLKEFRENKTLESPKSTKKRTKIIDEIEETDLCVIRRKVSNILSFNLLTYTFNVFFIGYKSYSYQKNVINWYTLFFIHRILLLTCIRFTNFSFETRFPLRIKFYQLSTTMSLYRTSSAVLFTKY